MLKQAWSISLHLIALLLVWNFLWEKSHKNEELVGGGKCIPEGCLLTMSDWAEREFGSDTFEPTEYAHKFLAANSSGNAANEDVSQLIGRLTLAVDDVAGQIRLLVATHHEALLSQAANVSGMEGLLSTVRQGINELTQSLERVRLKVRVPYQTLAGLFSRLQKLRQASDVLRRTSRFVTIARRLESQMKEINGKSSMVSSLSKDNSTTTSNESSGTALPHARGDDGNAKERAVARAALSIAELSSLLSKPESASPTVVSPVDGKAHTVGVPTPLVEVSTFVPLQQINVVARLIPVVEASRTRINEEMEAMIVEGLASLNQSALAAALQTAFNLRVMPNIVQLLLMDLTEAVDARIKSAFDVSRIAKEITGKEPGPASAGLMYRSRVRTEPTNITAPQWTNALWNRLEQMIEEMADCCIKVYNLEKVLRFKKDPATQASFLDEAMTLLENKPTSTFWGALARSLDKHSKDATKASTFLQQTLSTGYPRFLRLFHELFAKISVHTDTVYTATQQSPETIIVLRAVSSFEALYLSRSTARLNEVIATGIRQQPPGAPEGLAISRTVVNELDSARFDPLLVRSVAKNVGTAIDMLVGRAEGMIVKDRSATSLVGPLGTAQQASNAHLFTMLHTCYVRLEKLEDEFHESVTILLKASIKKLQRQCESISQPLLAAIRRDLSLVLGRIHRVDFSRSFEGGMVGGGASGYMKEISAKFMFLRNEIFNKFTAAEVVQEWTTGVAKNAVRTFVLNASIIKPLGEAGKLQLTSDMTELEFSLGSFLSDSTKRKSLSLDALGDDYRVLRALRPLLFLDTTLLSSPDDTGVLPPLIVLHHIVVRSPFPLPHKLHTWTEAEYVRWIEDHTPREALALIESCIPQWEARADSIEEDAEGSGEVREDWVTLMKAVLRRAVAA